MAVILLSTFIFNLFVRCYFLHGPSRLLIFAVNTNLKSSTQFYFFMQQSHLTLKIRLDGDKVKCETKVTQYKSINGAEIGEKATISIS